MTYVTHHQAIQAVETGAISLGARAKSPQATALIAQVIAALKAMTVAEYHDKVAHLEINTAIGGEAYLMDQIRRLMLAKAA